MINEGFVVYFTRRLCKVPCAGDEERIGDIAAEGAANLACITGGVKRQHLIGTRAIEAARQRAVSLYRIDRRREHKDRAFIGVGADDERHVRLLAGFEDRAGIVGYHPAVNNRREAIAVASKERSRSDVAAVQYLFSAFSTQRGNRISRLVAGHFAGDALAEFFGGFLAVPGFAQMAICA